MLSWHDDAAVARICAAAWRTTIAAPPLLRPQEPSPVFSRNLDARSSILFIGDHAGRAIPADLENLGLSAPDLARHIAWDIGVQALGIALSDRLGAPFIAQRYSRLVIDCNRDPARADAMPAVSDGLAIPGNQALSDADRARRVAAIFDPYHRAIAAELDRRAAANAPTVIVALHSFTPIFAGFTRPWRFGVLHMNDSALSQDLLTRLRETEGEAFIGDNEPYSMDDVDYSIPLHAGRRGLEYVELEVRQDLIGDPAGVDIVAGLLGRLLLEVAP